MADIKLEYEMYNNLGLVSQANNLINNLDLLLQMHCNGCIIGADIDLHQCLTSRTMKEKLILHRNLIIESSDDARIKIIVDVALFLIRNVHVDTEIASPHSPIEIEESISDDMSSDVNYSPPTSPKRDSSVESVMTPLSPYQWTPSSPVINNQWSSLSPERARYDDSASRPWSPYQWTPSSPEIIETNDHHKVIQQPSTSFTQNEQKSKSGEPLSSKRGKARNRRQKQRKSFDTVETEETEERLSLIQLGKSLRKLNKKYLEKSMKSYFNSEGNKKPKSAITLILSRLRQAEDMQKVIEKHIKFENV